MRLPRGPILAGLALLALAGAARADDPKPGDPKADPKAKESKASKKAPAAAEAIAWRGQWSEAVDEARERNVLLMLHSHGSTCPPCHAIRKQVFLDAEYVKWANESTVHVLSYDLWKDADEPEPLVEVERDGEKTKVIAAYPMFTPTEADVIAREVNAAVKFPLSTPWTGVIAQDGSTVLASVKKATSKEFRALYEAEQKKLTGPTLPRDAWRKARVLLEESTAAEFDEAWTSAVAKALGAKGVAKELPPALAERVAARLEGLDGVAKDKIAALDKISDPAARAKARAAIQAEFKGLPSADALPAAKPDAR